MRKASGAYREAADVDRAKDTLEDLQEELKIMQNNFNKEVDSYSEKFDTLNEELEIIPVYPTKSGINIKLVCLLWVPVLLHDTEEEIKQV